MGRARGGSGPIAPPSRLEAGGTAEAFRPAPENLRLNEAGQRTGRPRRCGRPCSRCPSRSRRAPPRERRLSGQSQPRKHARGDEAAMSRPSGEARRRAASSAVVVSPALRAVSSSRRSAVIALRASSGMPSGAHTHAGRRPGQGKRCSSCYAGLGQRPFFGGHFDAPLHARAALLASKSAPLAPASPPLPSPHASPRPRFLLAIRSSSSSRVTPSRAAVFAASDVLATPGTKR